MSCRLSHRGRPHHQSKEARSEHQFNDMPRSESFIFFQKTSPLLIVEKMSFISHQCSISYGFRHSAGIFLANSGRSRRRGPSTGSRFWTCRGPSPQTPGQEPKSIYAILSTLSLNQHTLVFSQLCLFDITSPHSRKDVFHIPSMLDFDRLPPLRRDIPRKLRPKQGPSSVDRRRQKQWPGRTSTAPGTNSQSRWSWSSSPFFDGAHISTQPYTIEG